MSMTTLRQRGVREAVHQKQALGGQGMPGWHMQKLWSSEQCEMPSGLKVHLFFSGSSAGKESACNEGDPRLILGSKRSTGGRIGYPLQYSWASLVAQPVKNPPVMQETWVRSLGWKTPLEKGTATHSSILAWRIP